MSNTITAAIVRPSPTSISSSATAWGSVRGKPSRSTPALVSAPPRRSLNIAMIRSSETRSPRAITAFASSPSGVPSRTAARSMSPVAMCARLRSAATREAWVPLPAPGGPIKIRSSAIGLLEEALVGAHRELRLDLPHRVDGNAHDDQHRGAAERSGGRLREPAVLDEQRRQHRDGGQEEAAGDGQPHQHALEVLGGGPPGAHAGNEPAVLLQVVRLLDRVEDHGH